MAAALLLIPFYSALLGGCQNEPQPRMYSEIAPAKPPRQAAPEPGSDMSLPMMGANPVDINVTWEAPEGWIGRDSSSSLRIGSYTIADPEKKIPVQHVDPRDPRNIDVSVVQLAGFAGGLEDNVLRWMKQAGIILPDDDQLRKFLEGCERFTTRTGQQGLFIDLTPMLAGDITVTTGIFGAIVSTEEYTVFVKASGERHRVSEERPALKGFCRTLAIEEPRS